MVDTAQDIALITDGFRTCFACQHGFTGKKKECCACQNGLTGKLKHAGFSDVQVNGDRDGEYDDDECGEQWVCRCETWKCQCAPCKQGYCPICQNRFPFSEYLSTVIADEKTLWLANFVTHFRHSHRAWDRNAGYIARHHDYDAAKDTINEQAKRQLVRKAAGFLRSHGIGAEHFMSLKDTTEETMVVVRKKLADEAKKI